MKAKVTELYRMAEETCANYWVPACGGHEMPFTKNGRRFLYVYNFAEHKHGWLDLGTDIVHDDIPNRE
jgi:hypothetical protein